MPSSAEFKILVEKRADSEDMNIQIEGDTIEMLVALAGTVDYVAGQAAKEPKAKVALLRTARRFIDSLVNLAEESLPETAQEEKGDTNA